MYIFIASVNNINILQVQYKILKGEMKNGKQQKKFKHQVFGRSV